MPLQVGRQSLKRLDVRLHDRLLVLSFADGSDGPVASLDSAATRALVRAPCEFRHYVRFGLKRSERQQDGGERWRAASQDRAVCDYLQLRYPDHLIHGCGLPCFVTTNANSLHCLGATRAKMRESGSIATAAARKMVKPERENRWIGRRMS